MNNLFESPASARLLPWNKSEKVVVIRKRKDSVYLLPGHVINCHTTYNGAHNIETVVVQTEDGGEESFEGTDLNILRFAEAALLRNVAFAQGWFQGESSFFVNEVASRLRDFFRMREERHHKSKQFTFSFPSAFPERHRVTR